MHCFNQADWIPTIRDDSWLAHLVCSPLWLPPCTELGEAIPGISAEQVGQFQPECALPEYKIEGEYKPQVEAKNMRTSPQSAQDPDVGGFPGAAQGRLVYCPLVPWFRKDSC